MYELGLKSYLFDRRVRLNLAVFDSEYEDMQLFFNTNPADLSVLVATNAGKATVAGAELETLWQVTERLRLTFDYTYLDASYDEVKAPANTIFDPAVNPDSPYQVGDNIKDVFTMPYAPENSFNAGLDWTFAEFDTSALNLILNYRWEDKTYLSAPAGPAIPGRDFYARDSFGLLDARVSWNVDFKNDAHGRMDVYMNNVLDDEWESHLIGFGNAIPVAGQPAGYSHNAIIWAERPIYGVNFVYEF
jgi:iron complex outermembrane receptor protein